MNTTTHRERKSNMNKWFNTVFLPSIFDRAGTNKGLWLTQRQTEICVQYMDKHSGIVDEFQGVHRHTWFEYDWDGRHVHMSYSKLNGCGQICFGLNAEESAKAEEAYKAQREQKERERAERLFRRHPEKWAEKVKYLRACLKEAQEDAEEDVALGILTAEQVEANIASYQAEIAMLLSVAS